MNKKVIISVICVIIAVCTAVVVVQGVNGNRNAEETFECTEFSPQKNESTAQNKAAEISSSAGETALSESESRAQAANSTVKKENISTAQTKAKAEEKTAQTQPAIRKKTDTQSTAKPAGSTAAKPNSSAETPQQVTVSFCVSCKNALNYGANVPQSGYFIANTSYTAAQGETAFDVLEKQCRQNGIELKYQSKAYIQSIGGLSEKDCGSASGWMYRVNGKNPNKAASKYVLQNGDAVEWYYVTNASDR